MYWSTWHGVCRNVCTFNLLLSLLSSLFFNVQRVQRIPVNFYIMNILAGSACSMNRRLKRAHSLYWFHCLYTCSLSNLDSNTFNLLATWLARCICDLGYVAWQWIHYLVDQQLIFEGILSVSLFIWTMVLFYNILAGSACSMNRRLKRAHSLYWFHCL